MIEGVRVLQILSGIDHGLALWAEELISAGATSGDIVEILATSLIQLQSSGYGSADAE